MPLAVSFRRAYKRVLKALIILQAIVLYKKAKATERKMAGASFSNLGFISSNLRPNGHQVNGNKKCYAFQMPLHYPRYKKAEYETMPEWKLDCLLKEYGLPVTGDVNQKRGFAMGAFLWPDQKE